MEKNRMLKVVVVLTSAVAVLQLLLSQHAIKITRLSAVEITGITLFGFIIFCLISLFAITRMKDSPLAVIFAILINLLTAVMATWYLRLLFSDEIFFRNLYYTLNRQTQVYELLPLGGRIYASIPLAVIILGAVVYYLSAFAILVISLMGRKKIIENDV